MKSSALVVRSWNGHAIQRRLADGYVNATAMCQVAGRRWHHYAVNRRAVEYIQALEGSAGIPADLLAQTITTGPNAGRGTWVHPRLAVDLARWISPDFAVWMDGWILEELEAKARPVETALPPLPQDYLTELAGMACSEITMHGERLGSMLGFPSSNALIDARQSLAFIRRRLELVERLAGMLQPLDRKRRDP